MIKFDLSDIILGVVVSAAVLIGLVSLIQNYYDDKRNDHNIGNSNTDERES
jgi:hypothetical protein